VPLLVIATLTDARGEMRQSLYLDSTHALAQLWQCALMAMYVLSLVSHSLPNDLLTARFLSHTPRSPERECQQRGESSSGSSANSPLPKLKVHPQLLAAQGCRTRVDVAAPH
jgi:hypothetical protein